MSDLFVRRYESIRDVDKALKAIRELGLRIERIVAIGRWRRLWPDEGEQQGPFHVNRGRGPCFTTVADGLEYHMVDDTSAVEVHFGEEQP